MYSKRSYIALHIGFSAESQLRAFFAWAGLCEAYSSSSFLNLYFFLCGKRFNYNSWFSPNQAQGCKYSGTRRKRLACASCTTQYNTIQSTLFLGIFSGFDENCSTGASQNRVSDFRSFTSDRSYSYAKNHSFIFCCLANGLPYARNGGNFADTTPGADDYWPRWRGSNFYSHIFTGQPALFLRSLRYDRLISYQGRRQFLPAIQLC